MKHICYECDTEMEQTGRLTWYCPDCDTCPECGCPNADGFVHYLGCKEATIEDDLENKLEREI